MSGNRVRQTVLAPELGEKPHEIEALETVGDHEADEVELVTKVPKRTRLLKCCVAPKTLAAVKFHDVLLVADLWE